MKSSKEIADRQKRENIITRSQFENRQAKREQQNNNVNERSDHDMSDCDFEPSQINSEIYSESRAVLNNATEGVNSANDTKRYLRAPVTNLNISITISVFLFLVVSIA